MAQRGRPRKGNEGAKKLCNSCNKQFALTSFYNTNSQMFADKKVPICKPCLMTMVNPNDINSVKTVLRQIDKPFFKEVWETSMGKENPFGNYMRMVNSLHQYQGMTWDSGETESDIVSRRRGTKIISQEYEESDFIVTKEMRKRWGSGYSADEYDKLETHYNDMKDAYEIETPSHEDYLKKICKMSVQLDRLMADNDTANFTKMSTAYDNLNKSAKFQAVQRTASDRTGGMNTFSEMFEYVEKRGFIPKFVSDEPMDIVDATERNMLDWTKKLVLGDPNLASIVEESIRKMAEKEAGFAEVESGSEDGMDEYDEIHNLYFGEDEEGEY